MTRVTARHFRYLSSTDTDSGKVATDRLKQEIEESTVTVQFDPDVGSITTVDTGSDTQIDIYFKSDLSSSEESELDSVVARHDGIPLQAQQSVHIADKVIRAETFKPSAENDPQVTHNFCDPTTWWQDAQPWSGSLERVDPGGGADVYWQPPSGAAPHGGPWIDVEHGRLDSLEHHLDGGLRVRAFVGGVQNLPDLHYLQRDFVCDYEQGRIYFHADPGAGASVTATLSYATSSRHIFTPKPGTVWDVDAVELQKTEDADLSAPIYFVTSLWNADANGEPTTVLDLGNGPVHAVPSRIYQNQWQFEQESNFYYEGPTLNFLAKVGDVATQDKVQRYVWNYKGMKRLSSEQSVPGLPDTYVTRLEIYSEIDGDRMQEQAGTAAAVTLYVIEREIKDLP